MKLTTAKAWAIKDSDNKLVETFTTRRVARLLKFQGDRVVRVLIKELR